MNPFSPNRIKCIFVLAGVLTFTAVSPARAVTPVYADNSGGGCNGLVPCHLTIQLAVNAASDPDGAGPLAAEVFVFPGEYIESVDLSGMDGGAMGDIQLITVGPTGVPTPGTVRIENAADAITHSVVPFTGDVTINGFIVQSTTDDGIDVVVNSNAVIINVTANFCGDGGVADEGIRAIAQSGNLTIINTTANSTIGGDGFDVTAQVGNVTVINSSADGNDDDGFDIVSVGGTITIDLAQASGNGLAGFNLDADGNISVTNTTANGNDDPGIATTSLANITFIDVTANNNLSEGLQINVDGNITIRNATLLANNTQGIEIDHGPGANMVNNTTILNVWVQGNTSTGISLSDLLPAGTHRVNGSIICSNFGDGLFLGPAATVNATGNYWGDLSGPTHASNPSGLGDTVNEGAGTINFVPFIDTITASVEPDPVIVGADAVVSFQFSNAAATVFLGPGPGDRDGQLPFILSTDNGTLTSSVGAGANVTERIINSTGDVVVLLSNAAAGTANVDVDPCGLVSSIAVTIDTDTDGDSVGDSVDGCPNDAAKTDPGPCGCGNSDADGNGNGTPDCLDVPPPPPPPAGCCAPGVFPVAGLFLPACLIGWRLRRRSRRR